MDDYAGKRAANCHVLSRKAVKLRDRANTGDQTVQVCNRNGFSSRLNKKGKQLEPSEKANPTKPSVCSSKGKEIFRSSSRTLSLSSKSRNSSSEPRKKLSSHVGLYKVGSIQEEPEASEFTPPMYIQKRLELETGNTESKVVVSMKVGSSSVALNSKSNKNLNKKPGVATQLSLRGPSVHSSSKAPAQRRCDHTGRYDLRNLKCNSVSDSVSSSSSSSGSSLGNRKGVVKKRHSEGQSSISAKGKKISGPSSFGRNPSLGLSIGIPETRRHGIANKENNSSSKIRRPSGSSKARVFSQETLNRTSPSSFPALTTPMSQMEVPTETNSRISSHQLSLVTSSRGSSYNRPSAQGLHAMMSIGSADISNVHLPIRRNSFRDCNIDGIEEVLLELERIQHEAELSYEQLLEMDSSLVLSGLNFYDQHRDMRLDVDNMSYEELLALEERMGTVSTALSEEALSKCLKRCIYQLSSKDGTGCVGDDGDVKCSICQEEYVAGDELGRLLCEHKYHVRCIWQWLRLKNWCPVCKAPADAS